MSVNVGIKLKAEEEGLEKWAKVAQIVMGMKAAADLGSRAFEFMRAKATEATDAALKFRAANDVSRKALEDYEGAVLRAKVALGDMFLPALSGVAAAMVPVIDKTTKWRQENRELISSGIVTWLAKVARFLVEGVGNGAVVVTKTFGLMADGIEETYKASTKFIAESSEGLAELAEKGAKIAKTFGKDGLAENLESAASGLRTVADRVREAGSAGDGIGAKIKAQADVVEQYVIDAQGRVLEFINTAEKEGLRAAKNMKQTPVMTDAEKARAETAKKARFAEQEGDAMVAMHERISRAHADATLSAVENFQTEIDAYRERRAAYAVELQKRKDDEAKAAKDAADKRIEEEKRIADQIDATAERAASAGLAAINEFRGIAESAKSVDEAVKGIAVRMGEMLLQTAAMAGLKALFSLVTGGVGGGLLSALFANSGAVVRPPARFSWGGSAGPGFDSVPALLTPNEAVVSVQSMRRFERHGDVPPELGPRGGSRSWGGVSAAPVSVPYVSSGVSTPTDADVENFVNQRLVPALKRARASGRL